MHHLNNQNYEVRTIAEKQESLLDALQGNINAGSSQQANNFEMLRKLEKEALACLRCGLRGGCKQVVFGDGNPEARLMLVGEGPGGDEDRIGKPFVGRAGQLLNRILEAAEIPREEIYITNVVKCRPPGNRTPVQTEVDACSSYLAKQFKLINPEIVICLGALATRTIIDKSAAITRVRGQWHEKDGIRFIATFHPAALLRDPGKKKPVWEDFKEVMKYYHCRQEGG